MGKGRRSRENRNTDVLAASKKNTKVKKNSSTLVLSLVCILLVGVCLFVTVGNSIVNGGGAIRKTVSVETENYKINNAMVTYFFGNIYQNYLSTYSGYLSYIGLDTNKSLKSQQFSSDGRTWFDYFMESALTQLKQAVVMCEAAKEAGMSLSDEDSKLIDSYVKAMKQQANSSGYTGLDGYLATVFGAGVNEDVFRQCLEIELLSNQYYEQYSDTLTYTGEQYEEYFKEHDHDFLYCDYKTYKFNVDVDKSATDEEKAAALAEAKADAEALAAAKTPEEFDQILRDYLTANLTEEDKEDDDKDPVEEAIEATLVEKLQYNTVNEFAKWAFEKVRVANDVKVVEDDEYVAVYMIVKPSYRNEEPTKNVRRIIFATSEYESKDAAKAKADEVLAKFLAGDKTGAAFAELAEEYSYDSSAKDNGGLQENYAAGAEYGSKFDTWCTNEDRKIGDAEVIENTTYGYEVVFYESEGIAEWEKTADTALRAADYEAKIETLAEQFKYTENKDKLNKIDA
ncbi:MAG: peptidylprolyl isomerase [Clostridia bacterium]|nr:peptidylprolyl isomerase [Clostridia bacterium]